MFEQNSPIQWQEILEITNNKEDIAKELVTLFGNELPTMQTSIQQAFEEKNYALLLERVHQLHGSCCYCGVPNLKRIAADLEIKLKQNCRELSSLIQELNQEIKIILDYISGLHEIEQR